MALSSLNLADLNGDNGFIISGAEQFDYSGTSVSSAGDINGDGIDDLIIGAPHSLALTVWTGESYIVFGKSSGFNANFNLADVNGNNGFVIIGAAGGYNSGISVSRAGDVNNDGIEDLIIGAPSSYNFPGIAVLIAPGDSYVFFGKNGNFVSSFDLEDLNGDNGFHIRGIEAGDLSGISVSNAGDVNGDGIDDLLIGASLRTSNGQDDAGESYIVFGSANGFNAELKLENLNGNNGFVIRGIAKDNNAGTSVSNAGDINGDGIDDFIITAPDADAIGKQDVGAVYLVFGSANGFTPILNLANLNGDNGFVIQGTNAGDRLGGSISNAGDVNGDGIDDLLIGAASADPNGKENAGETYVIFGKTGGFNAIFDLENLNGNNGFVIQGITAGDNLGSSVSSAGDFNGDGIDDLVIGADDADPNGKDSAGITYVLFGKTGGFDAVVNLQTIDSNSGIALNGIAANDKSGVSVSDAGDVNGDGIDDLVIGAWQSDSNGTDSGQSYVVFGGGAGNVINGTSNSETLTGTDKNDTINAGAGNDTLIGGNGNDIMRGEVGNDALAGGNGNDAISGGDGNDRIRGNAGNDTIDGGNGIDTFVESGDLSFTLKNTSLTGSGTDSLIRIEKAELTGGIGNNILNASAFTLGSVTLNAGAGNDTVMGGSGNDTMRGEVGNDALAGGNGNDAISGGDGNDRIRGNAGNDTIDGGNGIDTIVESANLSFTLKNTSLTGNGTDSLVRIEQAELTGGVANNTLNASAFTLGSVILNGGDGNDTLMGGSGNDIMRGEVGNDAMSGGVGNDAISGGDGNDRIQGNAGNDTIDGGNGIDTIVESANLSFTLKNTSLTGNGTDSLVRIEQAELTGGVANNTLNASAFTLGSVILNGGDGNDTLIGGSRNDILTGGNGNDTLVGGNGNDTLTGGAGSDRFTFNGSNQGIDKIMDFVVVNDTIAVSAAGFGGGLVANAVITAAQFVIGANATTATQRFIYNSTTSALFFDVDGNGVTAKTQIATLSTGLLMTNNDIFVLV